MSLEAAAALICKLGCLTELEQSSALAKVPTDLNLKIKKTNSKLVIQKMYKIKL